MNLATRATDCAGSIAVQMSPGAGVARVDMDAASQLDVHLEVCDPRGWVFHAADSPTCNGFGGDAATVSNDAEIHLSDTELFSWSNDYGPPGDAHMLGRQHVASARGCTSLTIELSDRRLRVPEATVDFTSPFLLRTRPEVDSEGPPDTLWWIGLNRTYGASYRSGTGLRSARFCQR